MSVALIALSIRPSEHHWTHVDAGLYAPMITPLAQEDAKLGARLGICLFPTGLPGYHCS